MTRFEYLVIRLDGKQPKDDELSRHGREGWELVAVGVQGTTHFCYFRRRTESEA